MEKTDIKSLNLEELTAFVESLGEKKFRAKQIYEWIHRKHVASFSEMTNISAALIEKLNQNCTLTSLKKADVQISKIDGTRKYLFLLDDGNVIESVLMRYKHGNSVCISSQVGCRMGCRFCMTARQGFAHHLTAGEILNQIRSIPESDRLTNVVYMGMGEPLDNYKNVLRFLELVSSENGLNIGMRHISLSTCGLVEKIYDLADRKLQLTLSVSLHAPNDEIRSRTMPVNRKWNVEQLLKACRYYSDVTGRRISFEYAMISGVNDSDACANELASRLRGIIAHVNLIPVNDVTGTGYRKSGEERLRKFTAILEKRGITATVRRTLGSDIEASCGQLRRRNEQGGTV